MKEEFPFHRCKLRRLSLTSGRNILDFMFRYVNAFYDIVRTSFKERTRFDVHKNWSKVRFG
jgi:hypothetical protein